MSRRDQLVQQLLAERRQRLQEKLAAEGLQDAPIVSQSTAAPLASPAVVDASRKSGDMGRSCYSARGRDLRTDSTIAPSAMMGETPAESSSCRRTSSRDELTWDSAACRLDAVLGGWRASSPPPRGRRSSGDPRIALEGGNRASARVVADTVGSGPDVWSQDEHDELKEFTFGSQEEPSTGSRSRSVERGTPSPPRAQLSWQPAGYESLHMESLRSPAASEPAMTSNKVGTSGHAASSTQRAAQRRPQSAPRAGRASSADAQRRSASADANRRSASVTDSAARRRRATAPKSGAGGPASSQSHVARVTETPPAKTSARPWSAPSARKTSVGPGFGSRLQEWELRQQATCLKQQQARKEKELTEMKQCTFKPSINTKSEFYARRSRGCYVEPLAARLHHEADKRTMLRQKAKELLEADEMCSYTFQPQINRTGPTGEEVEQTPLHLRTEEIRRMQQEKCAARQAAEDERSDCSFQPRISEKSDRIVRRKRDEMYRNLTQGAGNYSKLLGPVEDRLYAGAQDLQQRRVAMQSSVSEASQSAPTVDDTSRRICRDSVYFQGPQQDFVTRQQTFELAKQRRQEIRSQHADLVNTFKPEISDTSRQLVSGNIEYVGETLEERIHRLAVKDVERRDKLKGHLEQYQYRECTFRPELNRTSQMLAAKIDDVASLDSADVAAPVHERLYKQGQNRSRCSDDSRMEECTFAPAVSSKTSKRYAHIKSRYTGNGAKIMDNIEEDLIRKEEYLAEKRREREEQQIQQCTFNPETTRPYEEPEQAVIVSGLGRFFELRELARKQQEEQLRREAKIFHPESKARCDGITIPEPFPLSRGAGDKWRNEDSIQRPRECTFAPMTTESENRRLVDQILNSGDGVPDLPNFSCDAASFERARVPFVSARAADEFFLPEASTLGDLTNVSPRAR